MNSVFITIRFVTNHSHSMLALENGNPLVRVIVEGWHEAIGKQKATDCNEEDVLDPYFLAHVSVKDSK